MDLTGNVRENIQVLSDVERRRLSVAQALLSGKKIVILDELAASLDSGN
jgi:ABC-type multidrug transport system ATPase subunit